MATEEIKYGTYKKELVIRIKDVIRDIIKYNAVFRWMHPYLRRLWWKYLGPRNHRRLQKIGPQVMGRLHRLLTARSIPYYCDYGTLIGFVRNHWFLKTDGDIDISIMPGTSVAEVLRAFLDAGYGYIHGFDYQGKILEFTVADVSGVTIDVFFPTATDEPGKIHGYQAVWRAQVKYPSENANTVIEYDFAAASKITTLKIGDMEVQIPENFDEVLTSEYGPWRIPDAHFNTVTDRVHREREGFAYHVGVEEALKLG